MAKKVEPLPPGTTLVNGTNGSVMFDGQYVTIKHTWTAPGGRGESRYPISAVTGAEYKPGVITTIFTLVVSGGIQRNDGKNNRKGDPLSVQGGAKSREGFQAMRDRILQAVAERDQQRFAPPVVQQAPASAGLGDQLAKLGELRQQGLLTDAEFVAAKARLLGQPVPRDQAPQSW